MWRNAAYARLPKIPQANNIDVVDGKIVGVS